VRYVKGCVVNCSKETSDKIRRSKCLEVPPNHHKSAKWVANKSLFHVTATNTGLPETEFFQAELAAIG
jgi:hypothetical protein